MKLIYLKVAGDGNCFYHSLFTLINDRFSDMSSEEKNNYISCVKDILASQFNVEYYSLHLGHLDKSYEELHKEIRQNVGYTSHYIIPAIMESFTYNLIIIDGNNREIPDVMKHNMKNEYIYMRYANGHYDPLAVFIDGKIQKIFKDKLNLNLFSFD